MTSFAAHQTLFNGCQQKRLPRLQQEYQRRLARELTVKDQATFLKED